MSDRIGQDPDDVERLAAEFAARAVELDELRGAIGSRIASSDWTGPDRDRFHAEWDDSLSPSVANAADALRSAAQTASANADHQRVASGAA